MPKGLILAGGGARGSYQVGVFDALEQLGWQPDVVTGTSVGSLNGAMLVQGKQEALRRIWLSLEDATVMALPASDQPGEVAAFLRSVLVHGGLDVTPLQQLVRTELDEAAVRTSSIRYGLVTVQLAGQLKGLKPLELPIEEIQPGRLVDYIMASAACFPAIRPHAIDGEIYIDGGYQDNMPFGLAARMGATELLCVDVDGVGMTHPNKTGLPTTTISSHWDMGPLLRFEPATARRNIALGRLDALRAFGVLRGTAYGVQAVGADARLFVGPYGMVMGDAIRRSPSLALAEKLALDHFGAKVDTELAPLEAACKLAGCDPTCEYTLEELCEALAVRWPIERAQRFAPLFEPSAGFAPAETALAMAQPGEFLAAAALQAVRMSA